MDLNQYSSSSISANTSCDNYLTNSSPKQCPLISSNYLQFDNYVSSTTSSLIQLRSPTTIPSVNSSPSPSEINELRPFIPSVSLQVIWTSLFSLNVVSSILGNLIVILIICSYKQMRTKTNLFLLNLSIADLMMATFNTMFNFIFMLQSHWPFGDTYCLINNFLSSIATTSSVFTITVTCIDRYMAVVHPFKPRMNRTTSLIVVMLIWLLAGILALPSVLYSTTYEIKYQDGSRILCWLHWPDGVPNISQYDHIYNITFFVVTYAIPMLIMGLTYTRMSFVLWGSAQIGEMTTHQREAIRSKQKVVPMLIIVTIIFGLCWLPYQLYFVVVFYIIELGQKDYTQHIYLTFYWLAMFNSSLNPIIYCLLNKRFRKYSKKLIITMCRCGEDRSSNLRGVSLRSEDCSNLDHKSVKLPTHLTRMDMKSDDL
ncbi:tachykinin-like peptides receptor 86C isoform X2 [Panonychus citri]|uniref:tachykinin-like peptides receptor 86C isoform X2 n=1 Tax=Panonychus citri TaxID=50023 RepID=UPI00230783CC|nr:tachykinin-like peptides receptor 86C isoform X2 [Panonychus citri]